MTELYLIAHKVRGEPAFDIATCEEVEGEDMWIIPTSGHRAHPYWHQGLDPLLGYAQYGMSKDYTFVIPPMPASLPDHYPTAAEPRNSPAAGHGLLARLGLLRKTTIKRRV